jgi:hypothetical protein
VFINITPGNSMRFSHHPSYSFNFLRTTSTIR